MERKTTRAQFIAVSLKLFQQKGFKATTMRDIAQELNIEAATLYNYIKSKQALLDGLLFEIANRFHEGLSNIESSSYAPLDKIKALVNLNVRLTVEYPYHVSLLVNDWKHLEEPRRSAFVKNREEYEGMVRQIIQKGIETGSLRPMDLEIATYSILSSIRWLFSWYIAHAEDQNPIELEKQLVDFILKGMQDHS